MDSGSFGSLPLTEQVRQFNQCAKNALTYLQAGQSIWNGHLVFNLDVEGEDLFSPQEREMIVEAHQCLTAARDILVKAFDSEPPDK